MKKALILILFVCCVQSVSAQMTTRIVRDSLFIPWELVYGPDNHVWFTQKNGYICRLEPVSGHIDTIYHETNTVIQSEGGMLGMALHPEFSTVPEVFVAYDYMQGSTYKERIVKYTYSGGVLSNPVILLDNIAAANFHDGCRMVIVGDKLFITTGDATNQSLPQNLSSVNGKVLRINLDGSIPSDNPVAGNPVWSWGHRNAQGLVYAHNKLYSSEHGPNNDDELNVIVKGGNYGWPEVEGFCDNGSEMTFCNDSAVIQPLQAWTPTIAVCGIDYYHHPMFPQFENSILMVTLKDESLYQMKLSQGGDSIVSNAIIINGGPFGRLRDIEVAPNGRIYISTSNSSAGGSNRIDKIIEIYDPSYVGVTNIDNSKDITVYPNPAGDYTIIKLPSGLKPETLSYTLSAQNGKVVMKGKLLGNNTNLSTKALAPGMYQLQLTDEAGKIYTAKILKQ